MFTIMTCKNCGNSKGLNYNFTITEWDKPCDKCSYNPYNKKSFDFCSLRCSKLFIAKLDKHKCSDNYYCRGLQTEKNKISKVWAMCGICNKFNIIKYKKGMKVKELKNYLLHSGGGL